MGFLEDPAGPVQPGEEGGLASGSSPGGQALAECDGLGPLRQAFGAEQLAPDGAGKAVLAGVRSELGGEEGEGAARAQRNGGDLGWDAVIRVAVLT
jgi:hypothetical protein